MSNSNKATHQGTCQVCGAVQKLPSGALSAHGYTVQWGFFSGTCGGSWRQPFELSKDMVDSAILRAEAEIARLIQWQIELRQPAPAGTTKAWFSCYFPAKRRGEHSHYAWRELEIYSKEFTYDGEVQTSFYHAAEGMDRGEHNRRVGHINSIADAVLYANGLRASALDKDLEQLRSYVKWQQGRIAGWAPHPENLKAI